MHRVFRVLSFVCLLAWHATPASAQELAGCKTQSTTQWQIDRVSKDHLKLTGAVEVTCDDERFFADEIELFTAEDRLVATGNVVFTSGTSSVAAERLEFDTRARTGTFYNATGTAALQDDGSPALDRSMFGTQEPAVYFYGETLQKIGPKRYRITRGGFTTCVQPVPRWELTAGTVTLNLDHYAILTNTLFKVKGVPLLYLPIFYYPVQEDDRATGFLIPAYGTSTIRGQSLSNAFFWAINRSHDATFLHDWFSRTGQGFGGEYRYVLGTGSEGFLRTYGLREREATHTDPFGNHTMTPDRRSYEVRGQASHLISPRLRARGRADYFSSLEVQQTYFMNVYDASRRQRSFSGSLTGNVGQYTVTGALDRSEYFYGATSSSTRGGAPRIVASRAERPLFGSPAYLSINGEYNRMVVQRKTDALVVDQGLTRYDVFPRVRVPFTRWQFLTVNSTAGFRSTYWSESRDPALGQVEQGIGRSYYELQANVTGPVLNRIWTFAGSRYAEKLKHSVQPFFSVQRISAIDAFDRFVQIDATDTIVGNTTRLSYGVANRFYRKPAGDRSREIVNASIGQSYYTDARAAQYDIYYLSVGGTPPSRFSPVSLAVRALPTDYITANLRAEYDTQFDAFRTIAADGTIDWRGWLQASGGWSQRRFIPGLPGFNDPTRLDHYLNGSTYVRLQQGRFGGAHQFNYDVLRGSFLQQRFTAFYNAQCCGFAVEYQTYDLSGLGFSPVQQDRRFNFSFSLAGIGTFANFFGALGGGTSSQGYGY
jgi:LPS-assembly protein